MTEPLSPILAEIVVAAPIAHVFEVMTSEATVPQWLGCMNYRRALGTTFHMQQDAARREAGDISGATHCEIVVLDPPQRFSFTWYVPGTPKTQVDLTLAADGPGRTLVRLVHEGWQQFPAEMVRPFHDALKGGWSGAVLPNLKRVAEAR